MITINADEARQYTELSINQRYSNNTIHILSKRIPEICQTGGNILCVGLDELRLREIEVLEGMGFKVEVHHGRNRIEISW
jgi:hypothetical protein